MKNGCLSEHKADPGILSRKRSQKFNHTTTKWLFSGLFAIRIIEGSNDKIRTKAQRIKSGQVCSPSSFDLKS